MRKNKGYTFIELLGVIMILILVISPMLLFLNNLLRQSLENHTFSQMNVIASSVLDRAKVDLKQDAIDELNVLDRSTGSEVRIADKARYNIPAEFEASLTITLKDIDLNLYDIEVVVYSDELGNDRGLTLRTLVYSNE